MSIEGARGIGDRAVDAMGAAIERLMQRAGPRISANVANLDTGADGMLAASPSNISRINSIMDGVRASLFDSDYVRDVTTFLEGIDKTSEAISAALVEIGGDAGVLRAFAQNAKTNAASVLLSLDSFKDLLGSISTQLSNGIATGARSEDVARGVLSAVKSSGMDRGDWSLASSIPSAMQRAQTAAVSEAAGVVFYLFQGKPIKTTRPWCLQKEGRVFHIEEIRQWGREAEAGRGWDGMVDGTNEQTIFTYLGGWYGSKAACRHVLVPVLLSRASEEDIKRMQAAGLISKAGQTQGVTAGVGTMTKEMAGRREGIQKAWTDALDFEPKYDPQHADLLDDFAARVEPSLSKEEVAALHDYTGSNHKWINKRLRGEETSERFDPTIAHMRSAMDAHRLTSDQVVFRGVGRGNAAENLAKLASKSSVGTEFSMRGFSSASLDAGTDFIKDSTTVLRILAPKGTRAIYLEKITKHSGEFELLFDDDTKFRILGVEEIRRVTYIDVEALP